MYVYSRTSHSYSSYGLTLQKIKRLQGRLQKNADKVEEKLEKEKASAVEKDVQNKSIRPQSPKSIKSDLLGDFMFNPGGAASGTFVEIISNGVKRGGTGTFLDVMASGDTGGVGMMDILGNTGGGNLINIVTGITTGSITQAPAVSEQIVDPLTQKAQSIIAMNQIGSMLNING